METTGIQLTGVKEALEKFSSGVVWKAANSALNKVAKMGMTEARRRIQQEYGLSVKGFKRTLTVTPAWKGKEEAVILAKGKGTPLIYFGANPSKPGGKRPKVGVSALVKRSEGRKRYPGTFVGRMKSGHIGVFKRRGKERYPIEQEYRVSVATAFGSKAIQAAVSKVIGEKWEPTFKHELDYALGQAKISYERLD